RVAAIRTRAAWQLVAAHCRCGDQYRLALQHASLSGAAAVAHRQPWPGRDPRCRLPGADGVPVFRREVWRWWEFLRQDIRGVPAGVEMRELTSPPDPLSNWRGGTGEHCCGF